MLCLAVTDTIPAYFQAGEIGRKCYSQHDRERLLAVGDWGQLLIDLKYFGFLIAVLRVDPQVTLEPPAGTHGSRHQGQVGSSDEPSFLDACPACVARLVDGESSLLIWKIICMRGLLQAWKVIGRYRLDR
jgi:hypothetical protein